MIPLRYTEYRKKRVTEQIVNNQDEENGNRKSLEDFPFSVEFTWGIFNNGRSCFAQTKLTQIVFKKFWQLENILDIFLAPWIRPARKFFKFALLRLKNSNIENQIQHKVWNLEIYFWFLLKKNIFLQSISQKKDKINFVENGKTLQVLFFTYPHSQQHIIF